METGHLEDPPPFTKQDRENQQPFSIGGYQQPQQIQQFSHRRITDPIFDSKKFLNTFQVYLMILRI